MIDVTYIDHMGSDLSVVNAARVSFGKQSDWMPRAINNLIDGFRVWRVIIYAQQLSHFPIRLGRVWQSATIAFWVLQYRI